MDAQFGPGKETLWTHGTFDIFLAGVMTELMSVSVVFISSAKVAVAHAAKIFPCLNPTCKIWGNHNYYFTAQSTSV